MAKATGEVEAPSDTETGSALRTDPGSALVNEEDLMTLAVHLGIEWTANHLNDAEEDPNFGRRVVRDFLRKHQVRGYSPSPGPGSALDDPGVVGGGGSGSGVGGPVGVGGGGSGNGSGGGGGGPVGGLVTEYEVSGGGDDSRPMAVAR